MLISVIELKNGAGLLVTIKDDDYCKDYFRNRSCSNAFLTGVTVLS